MPLFNQGIQSYKKYPSSHPWKGIIKHSLVHKMKYAHNSVNNYQYPKLTEQSPSKNRVKFTIIGNRVTKEFIYCSNLVQGLHKYRWKVFDTPEIRGVTTVEWPTVLNNLKLQYRGLAFCLESQVAVIMNGRILGGERELRETIESKYHYHLDLDCYNEGLKNFITFIRTSGRPCVYMHISINDNHVGTLIFMLYSDIVPYTCENFLRLCQSRRGGYSGTPIHRIVKDCWIQCGGYDLKSTDLSCENYIVPHDRRGVIGMANDGRNVDCSTQFYVILQPATWMNQKYVAFGQLIDGEGTLKQIENVDAWYEAPLSDITIFRAGILNLECQDIAINKGTNEYIQGHIEDLINLGEFLYEILMKQVFTKISELEREEAETEEALSERTEENDNMNIRATQRFLRNKEDIEQMQRGTIASVVSEQTDRNEFDVEVYEYEFEYEHEEQSYHPISIAQTVSSEPKPVKNYYIPFTDVPYPDEVASTFDLKRLLKGDYCLENDLQPISRKKIVRPTLSYISEKFYDDSYHFLDEFLDSEDEIEIKKYLRLNAQRVSFAGSTIKNIARGIGKHNIFENARKSELITDEELRKFRLASVDSRAIDHFPKKVSLSIPSTEKEPTKIRRRPTGFVRTDELERIRALHRHSSEDSTGTDEDVETSRKVRIAPSPISQHDIQSNNKLLFLGNLTKVHSDRTQFPSALTRLYENVAQSYDNIPMLKDLKEKREISKNMLLTHSADSRIKSDENFARDRLRHSININESFAGILNLQHGKRAAHKISSDYVKTIDQIEQKVETSIRSVEFAKTRPSMSVAEYQMRNRKYTDGAIKESILKSKCLQQVIKDKRPFALIIGFIPKKMGCLKASKNTI